MSTPGTCQQYSIVIKSNMELAPAKNYTVRPKLDDWLYLTIITLRASCGAVYCNRFCLWVHTYIHRTLLTVCLFVGLLPRYLEIACINHLHQTGFVGKGTDHLQLIKFWPSCAPGKVVCGGRKFLAPPYYSQRAVFAPLWALYHCLFYYSKCK